MAPNRIRYRRLETEKLLVRRAYPKPQDVALLPSWMATSDRHTPSSGRVTIHNPDGAALPQFPSVYSSRIFRADPTPAVGPLHSCSCVGVCVPQTCSCALDIRDAKTFAYTDSGRLIPRYNGSIAECNAGCDCGPDCQNKVCSQLSPPNQG